MITDYGRNQNHPWTLHIRQRIVLGLTASVGGMTERLVKASTAAMFSVLDSMDRGQLDKVCDSILAVFAENQKNDRVTSPLLKFLDQLLTSGYLDEILEDEEAAFPMDLLALVWDSKFQQLLQFLSEC